jgi:hypothetical protein
MKKNFALVLIGKPEKYVRIFANGLVDIEFSRLLSVNRSVGVERNMYLITNAVALYCGGSWCKLCNLPFDVVYHIYYPFYFHKITTFFGVIVLFGGKTSRNRIKIL